MRTENDKIRLLAVACILNRGRKVTATQILHELDLRYDIKADRKTIYSDVQAIDRFMPIEATPGRFGGYKRIDWKELLNRGD